MAIVADHIIKSVKHLAILVTFCILFGTLIKQLITCIHVYGFHNYIYVIMNHYVTKKKKNGKEKKYHGLID
jgi:hypothetical protein